MEYYLHEFGLNIYYNLKNGSTKKGVFNIKYPNLFLINLKYFQFYTFAQLKKYMYNPSHGANTAPNKINIARSLCSSNCIKAANKWKILNLSCKHRCQAIVRLQCAMCAYCFLLYSSLHFFQIFFVGFCCILFVCFLLLANKNWNMGEIWNKSSNCRSVI